MFLRVCFLYFFVCLFLGLWVWGRIWGWAWREGGSAQPKGDYCRPKVQVKSVGRCKRGGVLGSVVLLLEDMES